MKILLCHNYYQQRGGEDYSFEQEADLLEAHGHVVERYTVHNDEIGARGNLGMATKTLWNRQTYREVRQRIREFQPELMHCTNTFPLMSPSVVYAARREKVPVVQALRNYRLLCPKAQFLRDGRICEDCLGRAIPTPAIRHGCYRESRATSAVVAGMLTLHRALRTWTRQVDLFYTLSEFSREKFLEAGFAAERIVVKPNFVPQPTVAPVERQDYACFVGRLSPEKGIATLLSAWEQLGEQIPLHIVGDGPLAAEVEAAARRDPRIRWHGRLALEETMQVVAAARTLVMPSVWYETFGRTIIEAFAVSTPAIVSSLGAMAELIEDEETGLLFEPGNADKLAQKVSWLFADKDRASRLGQAARSVYEQRYGAERNYQLLMSVYRQAMDRHDQRPAGRSPRSTSPKPTVTEPPTTCVELEPISMAAFKQE